MPLVDGLAAVTGVRLAPPQGPTGSHPEGHGYTKRAYLPWARLLGKYLGPSLPPAAASQWASVSYPRYTNRWPEFESRSHFMARSLQQLE